MAIAKPLRVCLIGTGYMGKSHALAWNAVAPTFGDVTRPELDLLVERSEDLAAERADQLGFRRFTSDWQAAVSDPDIDVVSITTPTGLHAEMAIAALAAGKHVWCEKPMSKDVDGARRMKEAADRAGKTAALGYNYIQSPSFRLILSLIESGEIGTLQHLRIEMDEDFMADPKSPLYAIYVGPNAGSTLQEFAVHPLSLLRMLVGDIEEVFAVDWTEHGAVKMRGDNADCLLKFKEGGSAALSVSRSAWGRKGRIYLQVLGSDGTILFDQERFNEVQIYSNKGERRVQGFKNILSGPEHAPYGAFIPSPGHGLGFNDLKTVECREVMRNISGEAAHIIDFASGLKIENALHSLEVSAKMRRWVSL